jgi:nitrite reductase/ring-hydroxylating ferredoxin subunit
VREAGRARTLVGRVAVAELERLGRVVLPYPPFHVLVVDLDGTAFAIEDACNHAGASLAPGRLEHGRIRCAAHGYVFDVRTGALLVPRGLCDAQRTFEVEREGDDWVVWDEYVAPLVFERSPSTGGSG